MNAIDLDPPYALCELQVGVSIGALQGDEYEYETLSIIRHIIGIWLDSLESSLDIRCDSEFI